MTDQQSVMGQLAPKLHRSAWLVILAAIGLLHLLPLVYPSMLHLLIRLYLYAVLGQGWNLLGGYTGQFSFGHSLFFGVGAYVSTLLYLHLGLTPWLGLVLGAAAGSLVGLFVGYLSFRYGLKGPFFALIMLAFAEIFHMVAMGWKAVGGAKGLLITIKSSDPLLMQFTNKEPFYYLTLWMVIGSVYLAWKMERTGFGLECLAVREDHNAAEALGVNTFKVQLQAMAMSAGMTAMCGTIYAQYLGYIDPDSTFGVINSVEIMIRPIIGGPGTAFGALLGSAVLTPLAEFARLAFQSYSGVYLTLYGTVLIVVVMFLPNGLSGLVRRIFSK
jgi:branched-chain amino acid transport system permease protein